MTINLLLSDVDPAHHCASMVQQIKALVHQGGDFIWSHSLREANQVADVLAKYELNHPNHEFIFEIVPSFFCLC